MKFRKIRLGQLGDHETIAFAVEELQKNLKKIDPCLFVEVLLLDEPDAACGDVVWVGLHDSFQVPEVKDSYLDDAIGICVENGNGYITGSNERSVLIAAYRFLKELGCEWVRPGEDGIRVEKKELEQITVSVHEAASCRYRGVCLEGSTAYEHILNILDYIPKVGMNEYMVQFFLPATFFENWYNHRENPLAESEGKMTMELLNGLVRKLEAEIAKRSIRYHKIGHGWTAKPLGLDTTGWHREAVHNVSDEIKPYLAEINGVRGLKNNSPMDTQLCYSQPKVLKMIADCVAEYCKEHPYIHVLHVWDGDNLNNWCECEDCQKLRPSDWFLKMQNAIDARLTEEGLSTKLCFNVSRDKLWAPLETKLNNPDRFVMMYAPITRSYDLNYGQCVEGTGEMTEFVRNGNKYPASLQDNMAYLREWQKSYVGDIFLFDYHLIWAFINDPGLERCSRNVYDDIRNLRGKGIHGYQSCQVQREAWPHNLPMHMMAKTLWNDHCDYEEVSKDYFFKAFGPDGDKVRAYLAGVSEHLEMYIQKRYGDPKKPYGPFGKDYDGLFRLLEEFLPTIKAHVAEDNVYTTEWKMLEMHNEYVRLYAKALVQWEQENMEEAEKLMEEVYTLLQSNVEWTHPVLDEGNMVTFLKRRVNTGKQFIVNLSDN